MGKEGVLLLGEGGAAAQSAEDGPRGMRSVWKFTLEKRQTEDVLHNVDGFLTSFNGEKVLYHRGDAWAIAPLDDLKAGLKAATEANSLAPKDVGPEFEALRCEIGPPIGRRVATSQRRA